MDCSPPDRIRELLKQSHQREPALEQAIRWKPTSWKRPDLEIILPEITAAEELSEELSDGWWQIRRKHVLMLAREPALGHRGAFAGAMIWGFGPIGYGASRTARMLAPYSRTALAGRLAPFASAAAIGPADAWDAVTSRHTKIGGLGPAFGTKVTYFLARSEGLPPSPLPLIADLNTSWAMWDLCGIARSAFGRTNYLRYVDTAHWWALDLGCEVDEVERALFEYGRGLPRGT